MWTQLHQVWCLRLSARWAIHFESLHGKQLLLNSVGSLILYRLSYGEQSTQSSENRSCWSLPFYVREKLNTTKFWILPFPDHLIDKLWWENVCPSTSYSIVTDNTAWKTERYYADYWIHVPWNATLFQHLTSIIVLICRFYFSSGEQEKKSSSLG